MNEEVGYTGDNPNSLKEAVERTEYEGELRRQYLQRKHGMNGAESALRQERDSYSKRVWGTK